MKRLTLKELQQFGLGILKDVAGFCERNGIRYSLGYGTMLGAVRHKGFIPWDDDIDIMMPREDYEKFRVIYKSDNYSFIDCRNTPDCYIAFGRVCDTERTVAISRIPWVNEKVGVWIDIFPIDRVPDDLETFRRVYDSLLLMMRFNLGIRKVHTLYHSLSLKDRLKVWILKRMHPRLIKRNPSDIVKGMNTLISLIAPSESHHWSQLCCPDAGTDEFFENNEINDYVKLPFEGSEFFVWKGYDKILRDSYGDFMTLPPKNKRKPLQSYISFYWKDSSGHFDHFDHFGRLSDR